MMLPLRAVLAAAILAAAAGCASRAPVYLTNPSGSVMVPDITGTDQKRQAPYAYQVRNGLRVSYSIAFEPRGHLRGYRLTLLFKNLSNRERNLEPTVTLQDANGFLIQPSSYEDTISLGAALAGTQIPAVALSSPPPAYYHSGTVRDISTGQSATYYGYSRPMTSAGAGFASGFANGLAQGAMIQAATDRREGRRIMRWAEGYWLRSQYRLPPGAGAGGALLFPADGIGTLPLRLTVEVDGERFEFLSKAAPPD